MYRLPDNLSNENGCPEAFLPGDLVRHRRYGYRGVIVSVDPECLAEDTWYHSNQTQPSKKQPWYHILVHNSSSTTYSAHSSIEIDPNKAPINHPLLDSYFEDFDAEHYVRNDNFWPG